MEDGSLVIEPIHGSEYIKQNTCVIIDEVWVPKQLIVSVNKTVDK